MGEEYKPNIERIWTEYRKNMNRIWFEYRENMEIALLRLGQNSITLLKDFSLSLFDILYSKSFIVFIQKTQKNQEFRIKSVGLIGYINEFTVFRGVSRYQK